MKIRIALNLLFLKYSCCFFNDEQYETSKAESNVKEIAKLPCNKVHFTEEGMKIKTPTLVMWFKFGIASPIYSVDFRDVKKGTHWSAKQPFGSRAYFNVEESVLFIERIQREDAGLYKCRIDFEKFPTKNYVVNLSIIVPPANVTVVDMSGTTVQATLKPILEEQSLQLTCIAHGGEPAPRINWWHDGVLIDNQSEVMYDSQVHNILRLDRVERKHHGSILMCEAVNGGVNNSISESVSINLFLRPLGVRLLGKNEIFSVGKTYEIVCEAFGSRPPANITWLLKGTRLHPSLMDTKISADENITTSILKYQPQFHHHRSKLACKTSNSYVASSVLSDTRILHVQYAPIVKIDLGRNLDESRIREGADVYFDCVINANPSAKKIHWTHNDKMLLPNTSGVIFSNQTLVLQSITKRSAGNYCCVASNDEGERRSEPFFLDVTYEPTCHADQQLIYGAIRHEQIEVICHVDANPGADTFLWRFNNSLIQTKEVPSASSSATYSVALYQPKNELDYGTLLCWAKNQLGVQLVPCVFHIIPAGKPETPNNCTVSSNVTENTIHISCESGFDGGLPQEFVCEVFTNVSGSSQLKWNITNRKIPQFTVTGLDEGLSYVIIIYSNNAKGRSFNRVELYLHSSTEVSEKHTQARGLNSRFFQSLWTVTLLAILIFLLALLTVLIISILKIRSRHRAKRKHKKTRIDSVVTPVHSDDERNPDLIPQIEDIYANSSRRLSATDHSQLKQLTTGVSSCSTFPSSSLLLNCTPVPVEMSLASGCDSVVQWIEPSNFIKRNFHNIVINTVPNDRNKVLQHLCTQPPISSAKESAV